jgi:hypothetical protein
MALQYPNDHAVLLDDGTVFLAGGGSCSSTGTCRPSRDTETYNPTTHHFTPGPTLTALSGELESATLLAQYRIVLLLDDRIQAMFYNPSKGNADAAGSWTPPGQSGLSGFAIAPLGNGKALIAGGWLYPGSTDMAELYDPNGGAFASTGKLVHARSWAQAIVLKDGRVLVVGGSAGSLGGQMTALASAELYDSGGSHSAATGAMATAREFFSAVLLHDGRVLVMGGNTNANGTAATKSAEIYNPATGTFAATGSLNVAREHAAATVLSDGRVLIVGGDNGTTTYASTELYNPATGTFTMGPSLPSASAGVTATLLGDGTVLVTGADGKAQLYWP